MGIRLVCVVQSSVSKFETEKWKMNHRLKIICNV